MTHGCAGHCGKAVKRSLKGDRRTAVDLRAPRARAHQRRPRDRGPNVFAGGDYDFHVAGGDHGALLQHHDDHRRGGWKAVTGFRSTCGASARVEGPGRSCERFRAAASASVQCYGVCFCTKLFQVWSGNSNMINADMPLEEAHNKSIEYGMKMRIVPLDW